MMFVQPGNVWSKVTQASDAELAWLDSFLTFRDPKNWYSKAPAEKLLCANTLLFPTGMIGSIIAQGEADGFRVELVQPIPKATPADNPDLSWLRDYQKAAVAAIVQKQRGIIRAPTGSGKTEIAVGAVLAIPGKWLFIVHRANLAEQAAKRYELRTGRKAGRVIEGNWEATWNEFDFIVATFQTISERLKARHPAAIALVTGATRLLVDESHTIPAASFRTVANGTVNAPVRIGLSGTPLAREDKRSLLSIATLGPIIYSIKTSTLINSGVLARPVINLVPHNAVVHGETFDAAYKRGVVHSKSRNRLLLDAAQVAEKPCLLFVKGIDHGTILNRALLDAGVKSTFIWGHHKAQAREAAIAKLAVGDLEVIVCSVVFAEGVDIPCLRSIVIGGAGKSVIRAIQSVGRGMRRTDGKTDFIVHEVFDRGCGCHKASSAEHHPGCGWLRDHAEKRRKAYIKEGYSVVDNALRARVPR